MTWTKNFNKERVLPGSNAGEREARQINPASGMQVILRLEENCWTGK